MAEANEQTTFEYQATNQAGEVVHGRITADNVLDAAEQLERQGLTVFSIQSAVSPDDSSEKAAPRQAEPTDSNHRQPSTSGDLNLESCLEAVFEQRESLIPALTAVQRELPAGQSRRELQRVVSDLRVATAATNLAQSSAVTQWLPLLISGIGSPEQLDELISRAGHELDRARHRRRLFVYPVIIGLISLGIVLMLSIFLLPSFATMYDEFGLQLPLFTKWILGLSDLVLNRPIVLLSACVLTGGLVYVFVRLWTHYALTSRLLGFLIPGDSSSVLAMSSLTGQLAELSDAGLALPDALWIAGQGCRHYRFQRIAERLAEEARTLGAPLRECSTARHLPGNVIDALDTSPKPNVGLLRQLSAMYADRVDQRTDWAFGVVQPLLIVTLGLLVGTIVIGLFIPLVNLISGLT